MAKKTMEKKEFKNKNNKQASAHKGENNKRYIARERERKKLNLKKYITNTEYFFLKKKFIGMWL